MIFPSSTCTSSHKKKNGNRGSNLSGAQQKVWPETVEKVTGGSVTILHPNPKHVLSMPCVLQICMVWQQLYLSCHKNDLLKSIGCVFSSILFQDNRTTCKKKIPLVSNKPVPTIENRMCCVFCLQLPARGPHITASVRWPWGRQTCGQLECH